jgi:FkbH-like protein
LQPTINNGLDYFSLLTEAKRADLDRGLPEIRIALLSDAATQQLVPLLRALLGRAGFNLVEYEGPFSGIETEVYDAGSALYRFKPDFIFLLDSTQALRVEYYARPGTGSEFLRQRIKRLERVWTAIQAHSTALILQSNFVLPYERLFGNFDHNVADSLYAMADLLNHEIVERARAHSGVVVNDVEAIASFMGRRTWFDERLWFLSKTFCALDYLPLVAQNMVQMLLVRRGRVVKCVVLDLDNTLWGGVIGDDGLSGIILSAHGEGESFHLLQSYIRELARRGVVLAVCSKNDMLNALDPFLNHPEMVLKREHITTFIANWNDKAQNIREIQKTLNIGFDSIVFLDDNPFERNLVRELLPDVIVPELPEDPADFLMAISKLNLFEADSFSPEDLKRTETYRAQARRREEEESYPTLQDFLSSLDMRITVKRWDEFHLPRIAQLIQRSNQFNLTTRRLSQPQCAAMMQDTEGCFPIYATLGDRLGDHGLVCVVTCQPEGNGLAIRDWLMSCRVLNRTVEQYMMTCVFDHAKRMGLKRVTGEYLPTAKNGMVCDFFKQFGFQETIKDPGGRTQWALEINDFQTPITYIREAEAVYPATIGS